MSNQNTARTTAKHETGARTESERSERRSFDQGYEEWSGAQEPDYGGAFDGWNVTSDADPGL